MQQDRINFLNQMYHILNAEPEDFEIFLECRILEIGSILGTDLNFEEWGATNHFLFDCQLALIVLTQEKNYVK